MKVEVDTSGLDRLRENLKKVDGSHELTQDDLFPDQFMFENTKYPTWDAFCEASGVEKIQENADGEQFTEFISENSDFKDFGEMTQAGAADWARRQLDL